MPQWAVHFDCKLNRTDPELVEHVARAQALAKVIHGVPLPPTVQRRIDSLNIMRAVRGTTGIEGTEVSETEVEEIMEAAPGKKVLSDSRQRAEQEVRNAEQVMRFIATLEPNCPITEPLICTIHRMTTEGIDYQTNEPGVYRSHSVSAGAYVPPKSHDQVCSLMEQFVEWFNNGPARVWPAPIRAIAAHFYVISIHPFGDGNGRTARGVESLLLYQGGINARGFYSLANYYYQNRDEYESMLDHVRFVTDGDITPFVKFALAGLVSEQEAVHAEILAEMTTIAFRDFAREELAADGKLATKPGERMYHFLLGLPDEPVSVTQLKRGGHPLSQLYYDMTSKTVTRDLNYLQEHNLIKIEDGQVRANIEVMGQFM